MKTIHAFDPDFRSCPRLADHLDEVKQSHPRYHARPVAPFCAADARCLIVGLVLQDCRITNAVKCLPPNNKPSIDEIDRCNSYLAAELADLPKGAVILALRGIAHRAVLKALGLRPSHAKLEHHALHGLPNGLQLVDSYHSSRYNVQTGRLIPAMFDDVIRTVRRLLEAAERAVDLCDSTVARP